MLKKEKDASSIAMKGNPSKQIMKPCSYYSNNTGKIYQTMDDLRAGEAAYQIELEKKENLSSIKRERAKAIEDAYKHTINVRKECSNKIKEADDEYYKLRDAFVKDYGSFHMTYTDSDSGHTSLSTFSNDVLSDVFDLFNSFPGYWF